MTYSLLRYLSRGIGFLYWIKNHRIYERGSLYFVFLDTSLYFFDSPYFWFDFYEILRSFNSDDLHSIVIMKACEWTFSSFIFEDHELLGSDELRNIELAWDTGNSEFCESIFTGRNDKMLMCPIMGPHLSFYSCIFLFWKHSIYRRTRWY